MMVAFLETLASGLPAILADDPLRFLMIGSLGAMIFGAGKVGFGGGVGLLSFPLMVYACDGNALFAAGLMLPLLIAADYVGVASWWREWQASTLKELLPLGCVGIAAGGLVLWGLIRLGGGEVASAKSSTGSAILMGFVGAIALLFVTFRLGQWITRSQWTFRPVWWQGAIAGFFWGFSSTLAHAAGPIATMYLLSQRLDKKRFVATTQLLFWTGNQLKLVPYLILGMVSPDSLLAGLWLVPAVVVGSVLGRWLNNRVNEAVFLAIVLTLLTLTGGHLIYKSLMNLL
jgi:hypothetical protein